MSGGHWNYRDRELLDDIFNYPDSKKFNSIDALEDLELSELLFDLLNLLHDFDWYICGDTSEQSYLDAKKAFKDKWLKSDRTDRLSELLRDELKRVEDKFKKLL